MTVPCVPGVPRVSTFHDGEIINCYFLTLIIQKSCFFQYRVISHNPAQAAQTKTKLRLENGN